MVIKSLSGCLSLQCLALGLVALAPVAPLAVDRAVQPLLALRAPLVLHGLTLRARAEGADVEESFTLVRLLRAHGLCEASLLLEPSQGCIVHP